MHELRVMSGLHRGAALPLIGDHWIVGSADDADLVLFDPGIATHHLRISLGDHWQVECMTGVLRDANGQECRSLGELGINTPFAAAGIWFCIASSQTAWPSDAAMDKAEQRARKVNATVASSSPSGPSAQRQRARPSMGKRLAVAVVIITMATTTWGVANHGKTDAPPDLKVKNDTTASSRQPVLSLPDAQRRLEQMLKARSLERYVSIEHQGDALVLTGEVSADRQDVVARMIDRFHQQYQSEVSLENGVKIFEARLPFNIRQIVGGHHPQIVLDNGHRLYPGDQVAGLKLTAIDAHTVSFQSDTRKFEVNW